MIKTSKTKILVHCALMIALAFVLSLITIYKAPYGGSVTAASLAPIILISCFYGVRWGLGSAFIYSIINLIMGISDLGYVPTTTGVLATIFLDYVFAFTVIGLAGIFIKKGKTSVVGAAIGTVAVMIARFAFHVISGAVIWYDLTKEWYADDATHIVNKHGAWVYSLIYNGTFMGPETVVTIIAVILLYLPLAKYMFKNIKA